MSELTITAKEEVHIFERPSRNTSSALIVECEKHEQEIELLKKQLEEQVVFTEQVQDFAIWMSGTSLEFGDMEYFRKNRHLLVEQPSPQLVAQFKADAVRDYAIHCNKLRDENKPQPTCWEYADQLTKGEVNV